MADCSRNIRSLGRRAALALAVVALLAPGAARAAATPLSPADRQVVTRAEAALNAVREIQSRFVQRSSNGGVAQGTLYVQRPGNLRIDYAPPSPMQVYADSFWLFYLDYQLKEANQVPVSQTPAAFLVRDHLSLTGDLTVTGVERRAGRLGLDIVRTDDPDGGKLRIVLNSATLALLGWVVKDPQGVETRVTLIDPVYNRPIDKKVFVYSPPSWAFGTEETEQ